MFKGEVPRFASNLDCSKPAAIGLYEVARRELEVPLYGHYSVFRDTMVLQWAGQLTVDEVYGVTNAAKFDYTDLRNLPVITQD